MSARERGPEGVHETVENSGPPKPPEYFLSGGQRSYPTFLVQTAKDLHSFRFAIANFVRNNLKARYRKSSLGFLWSLLNPLITMAVTATVFSLILRFPLRDFAVYVFTGLLPFGFMSRTISLGGQSIVHAETYLKKIYIPKAMFPLIAALSELSNFLLSLASLYILGLLIFELTPGWPLLLLPLAMFCMFLFSLGIGLALAVGTVYFRDLDHITEVGFSILFYLVPIIYPLDLIPAEYKLAFLLNPFYYFIELFRIIIYENRVPGVFDWSVPFAIAVTAMALGSAVVKARDRDLVFRL